MKQFNTFLSCLILLGILAAPLSAFAQTPRNITKGPNPTKETQPIGGTSGDRRVPPDVVQERFDAARTKDIPNTPHLSDTEFRSLFDILKDTLLPASEQPDTTPHAKPFLGTKNADPVIPDDASHNDPDLSGSIPTIDQSTGALSYSYQFRTPPGRRGIEPSLSLSYNSRSANEDYDSGYGWSLSVPSISVLNRNGIDTLYEQPTYVSSVSGELVLVSENDTEARYYPEVDSGDFLTYILNKQLNRWEVTNKQGVSMIYGMLSSAREYDPANDTLVSQWNLSRITDSWGNFVHYTYVKDMGRTYVEHVMYTNHDTTAGPFQVTLSYEDRNDVYESYMNRYHQVTRKRLSNVESFVFGEPVFEYTLEYIESPESGRSLLDSITYRGVGTDGQWLEENPTTFTYTTTEDKGWEHVDDLDDSIPGPGIGAPGTRLRDINGDGYSDYIVSSPSLQGVYLYGGSFTPNLFTPNAGGFSTTITSMPLFEDFDADYATLEDVNNDGLEDFVSITANGAYLNTGDGWSTTPATGWNLTPASHMAGYRFADVNGDGLIDYAYSADNTGSGSSDGYVVRLNTGTGFVPSQQWTDALADLGFTFAEVFQGQWRSFPRFFHDVNKDGLADIVVTDNSDDNVYINTGTGWIEDPAWHYPYASLTSNTHYQFSDVNGDRLADFVAMRSDGFSGAAVLHSVDAVYQPGDASGHLWQSDPAWRNGYWNGSDSPFVGVVADINGDLLPDIVHGNDLLENTGEFTDLLTYIEQPYGASVEVSYEPVIHQTNGDEFAHPDIQTNFPVVNEIIGRALPNDPHPSRTTYHYVGGEHVNRSAHDRRFAGFSRVESREYSDSDTLERITVAYLHQGNESLVTLGEHDDSWAKIGRVYRTETYDADGTLYQDTITRWQESTRFDSESRFVFADRTVSRTYDPLGYEPALAQATMYEYDESTGNLESEHVYGSVIASSQTGSFIDIPSDGRITTYDYAESPTVPEFSLVSGVNISSDDGTLLRKTQYRYDDMPLGFIGERGAQTHQIVVTDINPYTTATTRTTYTDYGLADTITNPRGYTTTFVYDALYLYPEQVINPLGHTARSEVFAYQFGTPARTIHPNGFITETSRDGLGRPLEVFTSTPDDANTLVRTDSYTYETDGTELQVIHKHYPTDDRTETMASYTDGYGRTVQTKQFAGSGLWVTSDVVYDSFGRATLATLPYYTGTLNQSDPTILDHLHTTTTYDVLDRPLTLTNIVGTTTNTYSASYVTTLDPHGAQTTVFNDTYGRIDRVRQFNGGEIGTTSYTWNSVGDLIAVTDASGNIRTMTYDLRGLPTRIEDFHAPYDTTYTFQSYRYDGNGNAYEMTRNDGEVTSTVFDELDRPRFVNSNTAPGIEEIYGYDVCMNGTGMLCSFQNPTITVAQQYHVTPGAVKYKGAYPAPLGATSPTIYAFTYDTDGTLRTQTSMRNGTNTTVSYDYDERGFIDRVDISDGDDEDLVALMTYSETGAPETILYGNNVLTQYEYDPLELYRLRTTTTRTDGGSGDIMQHLGYTYDPVGSVMSVVDQSALGTAKHVTYTYDDLSRLTSTSATNVAMGDAYTRTYTYDILGNITSSSDVGSYVYPFLTPDQTSPYTPTSLAATPLSYDSHGNVISFGAESFTYDYRNLLTSHTTNGITTTYGYNAQGQRVFKETNGIRTTYLPHGIEYDSTGNEKVHVSTGSMLLATYTDTGITFHHSDHIGTSQVVTNGEGHRVQVRDSYPYGELRFEDDTDDTNDYFAGHLTDDALVYMQARYYHPILKRFLSVDPASFTQPQDFLRDPQQMNGYSYARNNPVNVVDPDGREPRWGQLGGLQDIHRELLYAQAQHGNDIRGFAGYFSGNIKFTQEFQPITPSKNEPAPVDRYLYTEHEGWVDLHHLLLSASYTKSGLLSSGASFKTMFLLYSSEALQLAGRASSAFSYEDLPSNRLGVEFWETYGKGIRSGDVEVSNAMVEFLQGLGATDPSNAPNYDYIPYRVDPSGRYTPKNFLLKGITGSKLQEKHLQNFADMPSGSKTRLQESHHAITR